MSQEKFVIDPEAHKRLIWGLLNAYESGYGYGVAKRTGYKNPYPSGSADAFAWQYGFDEGALAAKLSKDEFGVKEVLPEDVHNLLVEVTKYLPQGITAPTTLHGFAMRASALLSQQHVTIRPIEPIVTFSVDTPPNKE